MLLKMLCIPNPLRNGYQVTMHNLSVCSAVPCKQCGYYMLYVFWHTVYFKWNTGTYHIIFPIGYWLLHTTPTLTFITAYHLLKLFMGSIWSSEKRVNVILQMVTIHTYIPYNVLSFLWRKGHISIYYYDKRVFSWFKLLNYLSVAQLQNITITWMMITKTLAHKISFIIYSTNIFIQHAFCWSTCTCSLF